MTGLKLSNFTESLLYEASEKVEFKVKILFNPKTYIHQLTWNLEFYESCVYARPWIL